MKISLSLLVTVVVIGAISVTGCADSAGERDRATERTDMRTDIEPLAGRLPSLGVNFTAEWFGNLVGDGSGPGSPNYWVEALITPADGVAGLIGDHELSPGTPNVGEQLSPLLPACDWERSNGIDRAWGPLDWETHVWFCQETDQLVISSLSDS